MKPAFLVLGAESSGTRLVTRILIAAGAAGDDGHQQRWDESPPVDEAVVVWRRSLPHDRRWPEMAAMVAILREREYDVMGVVTTRDWYATTRSQVIRGHVETPAEALDNLRTAYGRIFGGLHSCGVPYLVVSYDNLVRWPAATIRWLVSHLGLETVQGLYVYDGNAKYYVEVTM